ncbi:MAG: response regulator [Candidatus Aminicenantes bacterium]|nr:response regulator [Candidatus Aminicenantes bacterium]
MIIDLESSQATMITMHLMRSGYKVISSPNGETGIFEIVEERPDIILLDGSLSRNADYTALKEFKDSDINVTIPFILITQESSPEKIEQEMEKIGADDYIITPFSAKELIEKIEENLQA